MIDVDRIKRLLAFTGVVVLCSVLYYLYIKTSVPMGPERETFLSEVGEIFGEIGLWLMAVIYGRTIFRLVTGQGQLSRQLLPGYKAPKAFKSGVARKALAALNRTHNYVGMSVVVVIMLHVAMVGFPFEILFFPAVLLLLAWQAAFGVFISWKYSPTELRKFSYLVHAQLVTGILIGVFAYFGHVLVD